MDKNSRHAGSFYHFSTPCLILQVNSLSHAVAQ